MVWPLILCAVFVSAGCGGSNQQGRVDMDPAAQARRQAPVSLILPRLGGGEISLQELRGAPVVVTLFSTWSMRAQAEAPLLVQLHERHQARGLQLVGVAITSPGEKGTLMVETYVEVNGVTFPVALSAPDNPDLVAALGPVRIVPRTLLLDGKGRIVLDQPGQTDFAELYKLVERLLGK